MARKKAFEIIDINVLHDNTKRGDKGMDGVHALANALYVSAKGSRHFFEALELIIAVLPNEQFYKDELEKLKSKYE